jgi:predicted nuclease of restriction endonuclease-like (RecB) superfamily
MRSKTEVPVGYGDFLIEVKTQIRQRQLQALRAVNSELLALYWWLGENISQRQAALGWGKAVVENLARDLQTEFPGRNGFSAQNLWLMRQFVSEYTARPKLQSLIGEISWTKNLLIMARCKDDLEREFYEFQNPKKKKPRLQSPPQRAGEGVPRLTGRFYNSRYACKLLFTNKSKLTSPLSDCQPMPRHWTAQRSSRALCWHATYSTWPCVKASIQPCKLAKLLCVTPFTNT